MWIKICGTTNLADALLAIEHGADALGFIFAPSKRRVSVDAAATITARLPAGVERVGVFTSADVSEILRTVTRAGLTAVQLHFPHDPAVTAELHRYLGQQSGVNAGKDPGNRVRLIQVVGIDSAGEPAISFVPKNARGEKPAKNPADENRVAENTLAENLTRNTAKLRTALADRSLWAILLDTETNGRSGGLGSAFSWSSFRPLLREALSDASFADGSDSTGDLKGNSAPKVLLAGGLHAENVAEAIRILDPWGVDCVSGVEAEPGSKDPVRLRRFMEAARKSSSYER